MTASSSTMPTPSLLPRSPLLLPAPPSFEAARPRAALRRHCAPVRCARARRVRAGARRGDRHRRRRLVGGRSAGAQCGRYAHADRSRQRRRKQHEPADPCARRQLRQAEGRRDGRAHCVRSIRCATCGWSKTSSSRPTSTTVLGGGFDYVIDAIDSVRTKTALIAWCVEQRAAADHGGRRGRPARPDAHSHRRSRADDPGPAALEGARPVAQTAWLSARTEGEVQGERGVFRRAADLSGSGRHAISTRKPNT